MSGRTMLLSSVCKPFGAKYGDGFSTRPSALWQNTWIQGVFFPETVDYHWGLDLIAQNLAIPTKVLHYPTMARFIFGAFFTSASTSACAAFSSFAFRKETSWLQDA